MANSEWDIICPQKQQHLVSYPSEFHRTSVKTFQIILFQTYLIGWMLFKIYIIFHLSRLQKAFLIKKFTIIYLLKSILFYCISNMINQIKKKIKAKPGPGWSPFEAIGCLATSDLSQCKLVWHEAGSLTLNEWMNEWTNEQMNKQFKWDDKYFQVKYICAEKNYFVG